MISMILTSTEKPHERAHSIGMTKNRDECKKAMQIEVVLNIDVCNEEMKLSDK